VKTVDAKGKWKKFVKDAVGNLTSVWEPSPTGGADLESTYSYDAFDRLTGVTKLRGSTAQTRTFSYGVLGLTSKIEPETGSSTFYYRGDGRLDYMLDAKGQKVQQVYEDDLTFGYSQKRLAQIRKYPAPGTTEDLCQRVEMFYDGAVPTGGDAGVSSFSAGRLSGVRYQGRDVGSGQCSQTFVEQYSYTNYGAVVKKRVKMIRGAASGVLESVAEYDGEGRLKSVTYPVTNRKVQYGFNSRGLPETLTDVTGGGSTSIVSSVAYGVAGEVTTFVSAFGTETRGYNVNGQLTSLTMPGRTIAYNYPAAGQNNGKIESMTESGETIVYQYDSLQRLSSATGTGWSQTYGYDVFGNMNAKTGTGSAPSWSGTIDAATNRLTAGVGYDANGNQTNVPLIAGSEMPDALSSMVYDVSNRLIRAENNGATRRGEYDYDPGNKRVYEKRSVNSSVVGEWAYFFGITGQRMGRYTFTVAGSAITFSQSQASVWFGGKLVQKLDGGSVSYASEDRLGSVGKYLPYGEAKPGSSNPGGDNEKFATYTRDAGTGLDYADQRWHVPGSGRFLTSDPYQASGGPADPGSWNRFGYVLGDPVGLLDPNGLDAIGTFDLAARTLLSVLSTPPSASVTVYGGGGSSWYNYMSASLELEPWLLPPDGLMFWQGGTQGGGSGNTQRWARKRDECHERNLQLLAQYGIPVGTTEFGPNGGVRWTMTQSEAKAMQDSLLGQGWTGSSITGRLHNDDVGSPNYDLRSISNPGHGLRSIQIVIGPADADGIVFVYADSDLANPNQSFWSALIHAFAEVVPDALGFNQSCSLNLRPRWIPPRDGTGRPTGPGRGR
jgi:RHS repeat-associated protein